MHCNFDRDDDDDNDDDDDDDQGSEKWIAQIAALLEKMTSVGQIKC